MEYRTLLVENFSNSQPDPRLEWFNEPADWGLSEGGLVLRPDANTDFWRNTHYGFNNDSGHCLWMPVEGDFILSTRVHFAPKNQYDQAGLMVRFSADCWLKASVEYEPEEPARLGAVVTNFGYSDWATQEFVKDEYSLHLRIRRQGMDYFVEFEEDGRWVQMRMAHLHEGSAQAPVLAGLYACSPIAGGYEACFKFLKIEEVR